MVTEQIQQLINQVKPQKQTKSLKRYPRNFLGSGFCCCYFFAVNSTFANTNFFPFSGMYFSIRFGFLVASFVDFYECFIKKENAVKGAVGGKLLSIQFSILLFSGTSSKNRKNSIVKLSLVALWTLELLKWVQELKVFYAKRVYCIVCF